MSKPPLDVLNAFGVEEELVPLAGGQGLCFRSGDLVLRPVDDANESQWISELPSLLPKSEKYRVAKPRDVKHQPGQYVFQGWTAWTYLGGEPGPHFEAIIDAGCAFHQDVANLNISLPIFGSNRWREADLVTWEGKKLSDVANVDTEVLSQIQTILTRLENMIEPIEELPSQVIHGDLTGNVLFEEGAPPAIIDFSPYYRPAKYAEAIVVADALTWHKTNLTGRYVKDDTALQLLLRALYWRCLTFAIDPDLTFVEQILPRADFEGAVEVVTAMKSQLQSGTT